MQLSPREPLAEAKKILHQEAECHARTPKSLRYKVTNALNHLSNQLLFLLNNPTNQSLNLCNTFLLSFSLNFRNSYISPQQSRPHSQPPIFTRKSRSGAL